MLVVIRSAWPLLLGMLMLMVGNGLQGTLLGVRGQVAEFSTMTMSIIMSAYFVGFLGGSKLAPKMIARVGHVRVFAALGSAISAVLILYPALVEPWAWILGRVIIGFCFSGVYVTAESWLNNATTNETRGQALSLYMIVQMGGIVGAQYLLLIDDPSGYLLFIIPSVLVSLAFAPILLSVSPTPAFDTTAPMNLRGLIETSPLASVGMVLLGAVFAAQFGMSAVYASQIGLGIGQISVFVSAIYISALIMQYPIGWLSDRMDRRLLVIGIAAFAGAGALLTFLLPSTFTTVLIGAAIIGGTSNPLYALLLAYANDHLEHHEMAAASAGFVFINGVGAIMGPLAVGWLIGTIGPEGFWLFISVPMLLLALYGLYRITQRDSSWIAGEAVSYAPVLASSSPVAVEVAQEVYIDAETESAEMAEDAGH